METITNKTLKKRILEISHKYHLSHLGSNLTAVDIIDEIYQTKKPDEKFVLSSGHAHLAHIIAKEQDEYAMSLHDISKSIEFYGIHCERKAGCNVSTGSLGHGLGIAVGMALADRTKNVYCLVSDGEMNEGSIYEALEVAHEQKLTNLKVYINCNGWGAYKTLERDHIVDRCKVFTNVNITFRQTSMDGWPSWLQGQEAHYHIMSDEEYEEALEVLK